MSLWKTLYAMVWLAFLQVVLGVVDISGFKSVLVSCHVVLGFVILGLAHYDNVQIKKSEAPGRLKRTAKATAVLATIQVILGIFLLVNLMVIMSGLLGGVVGFLHLVTALAIITQASSVATAYDMWEEKEFTKS
jgi:uncharacterized membrane protein YkgB